MLWLENRQMVNTIETWAAYSITWKAVLPKEINKVTPSSATQWTFADYRLNSSNLYQIKEILSKFSRAHFKNHYVIYVRIC